MKCVSRSFSNFEPWNKGKLVGQKLPLKLKDVWAIRIRLQVANRFRDLALFNLAIDSKLRACDLVSLKVRDIHHGGQVLKRAKIVQQKTHQPVQFEITTQIGDSLSQWIMIQGLTPAGHVQVFLRRLNVNSEAGITAFATSSLKPVSLSVAGSITSVSPTAINCASTWITGFVAGLEWPTGDSGVSHVPK